VPRAPRLPTAWPAASIETRPVAQLVPYARNSRQHSETQIGRIMASMREYGFTVPILVDEEDGIIAGHARALAADRLGIANVPVMVARGWSEAQRRSYVIADNALGAGSTWDLGLLKIELDDLKGISFNLDILGFDTDFLKSVMEPNPGRTDPDEIPPPLSATVSLQDDIWVLGNHRLVCGDCTNAATVGRLLVNDRPHLMVTDPPYGIDYDPGWRRTARNADGKLISTGSGRAMGTVRNDTRADWRDAWALFPGDVVYCWSSAMYLPESILSLEACGFERRTLIVWAKSHHTMGRGHYHSQDEECWYAVRKGRTGHWNGGRKQTTVWQIEKPQKNDSGHSTQKPVECMKRPIENNSVVGDVIYDPFMGSGTSIVACELTGRHCRGIEINPDYVDLALMRWQSFATQDAILQGTGETFAQVSARRSGATAPASKRNGRKNGKNGKRPIN